MTTVLYVTDDFKPYIGGIAEHVHQMSRHLAQVDVDVTVMALVHPDAPIHQRFDETCGYPVRRTRSLIGTGGGWKRPWTRTHLTRDIVNAAREVRADCLVVGFYMPMLHLAARIAGRLLRLPVVAMAHGEEVVRYTHSRRSPLVRLLMKRIYRSAPRVVCVSSNTAAIVAGVGVRPDRIALVNNGVDISEYDAYVANPTSSERIRAAFPPGAPVVLTIAQVIDRKGIDKVIEAMPRILDAVPNARYVVGGYGWDYERTRELARRSPASGAITLLGRLTDDEVRECYSRCDVFAMLSRPGDEWGEVEGFGLVYLEAAAFGKPVVAGAVGGALDAVSHEETGLLVNPTDAAQIADAIVRLLRNPDDARRMGAQGRRRVEAEFTWAKSAEKFRAVLEGVVTQD